MSTLPFSELAIYSFNISANCTTCLKNNVSSKNFHVYTYINFARVEIRKQIIVPILPTLHNQTCNIIGHSKWNLIDNHRLVKYNHKHKTPITYTVKISFNENVITIVIETYQVPIQLCTIL